MSLPFANELASVGSQDNLNNQPTITKLERGYYHRKACWFCEKQQGLMKMKRLMTLREVCDYVRCSETTVRRWIAEARHGAGTFPLPVQERKGGRLLFDPQALAHWANARPATPQQTPPLGSSKREQPDKKRRLELARVALERHQTVSQKGGRND